MTFWTPRVAAAWLCTAAVTPLGFAQAPTKPPSRSTAAVDPAADRRELPLSTDPFGPEVFRERRRRLMSQMKNGVALVLSAVRTENHGTLQQDADFLYLTGLAEESEAAVMLAPQEPHPEVLFLGPLNPERDRWVGYRAVLPNRGVELRTGFEKVQRSNQLGSMFADVARRLKEMHFFGPVVGYELPLPKVLEIYTKPRDRAVGSKIQDAVGMLGRMRSIKEPREL